MGAARAIVAVEVAIHNLKRNTNTSHWLQALVATVGKDSCVFSRTPMLRLVGFVLNFAALLWKFVLLPNFYFEFNDSSIHSIQSGTPFQSKNN
jgi:hypothetical protein